MITLCVNPILFSSHNDNRILKVYSLRVIHARTAPAAILAILILIAPRALASNITSEADLYAAYNAARTDFASIQTDDKPPLDVSGRIQFRYQYNERDSAPPALGSDNTTLGFMNRRVNLFVNGKVTDSISFKSDFTVVAGTGDLSLEYAFATWKLSDELSIAFGALRAHVLREEYTSASRQLGVERSPANETLNQDFTNGIELTFTQDRWRIFLSINDGVNSELTFFNSTREADYAFSARVEARFFDAPWSSYKQFTSFRGANNGLLLGLAAHHQSSGETNITALPRTELTIITTDASWVSDGWNAAAVLTYWRTSSDSLTKNLDNFVTNLQGGFFVSEKTELYTRFSMIFPDDDNTAPRTEDFKALMFGFNHYLIPESHAAKFTCEVMFALDPTTTSNVATSAGFNLLPDMGAGQLALTAQMQLLF